jgi:hypothetical protein
MLAEHRRVLHDAAYRRLHCNQHLPGDDAFISAEDWDACGGPIDIPAGSRVVAAVDAGIRRDSTAVVTVRKDDAGLFHAGFEIWTPTRGREVRLDDVEEHITERVARLGTQHRPVAGRLAVLEYAAAHGRHRRFLVAAHRRDHPHTRREPVIAVVALGAPQRPLERNLRLHLPATRRTRQQGQRLRVARRVVEGPALRSSSRTNADRLTPSPRSSSTRAISSRLMRIVTVSVLTAFTGCVHFFRFHGARIWLPGGLGLRVLRAGPLPLQRSTLRARPQTEGRNSWPTGKTGEGSRGSRLAESS